MEAVVSHVDSVVGIGVFGLGGVKGDRRVIRIGIVVILAGLRVFEPFVVNEMGDCQAFFMIEVDDFQVFVPANGDDGVGNLCQRLAILSFIRAPGVVLGVVDIDEIGAGHGRDEDDGRGGVEGMQLVEDDAETTVDGAVAGIVCVIIPTADMVAVPPIVCAQKDCIYIADRDLQLFPGVGEISRGPAVMSLVVIMDIR